MSEVFFYHLTQTRLEAALPKILERAVSTDWLVELRIGTEANVESISDAIWKGPDDSFLQCGKKLSSGPFQIASLIDSTLASVPILNSTNQSADTACSNILGRATSIRVWVK